MASGMQFNNDYRIKWTQAPAEINFMKFVEGRHLVNHFSNSRIFCQKITTLETLDALDNAMQVKTQ